VTEWGDLNFCTDPISAFKLKSSSIPEKVTPQEQFSMMTEMTHAILWMTHSKHHQATQNKLSLAALKC
jgi:hypothetical protein